MALATVDCGGNGMLLLLLLLLLLLCGCNAGLRSR